MRRRSPDRGPTSPPFHVHLSRSPPFLPPPPPPAAAPPPATPPQRPAPPTLGATGPPPFYPHTPPLSIPGTRTQPSRPTLPPVAGPPFGSRQPSAQSPSPILLPPIAPHPLASRPCSFRPAAPSLPPLIIHPEQPFTNAWPLLSSPCTPPPPPPPPPPPALNTHPENRPPTRHRPPLRLCLAGVSPSGMAATGHCGAPIFAPFSLEPPHPPSR